MVSQTDAIQCETWNLPEQSVRFCLHLTKAHLVLNSFCYCRLKLYYFFVNISVSQLCPTEMLLIDKECKYVQYIITIYMFVCY